MRRFKTLLWCGSLLLWSLHLVDVCLPHSHPRRCWVWQITARRIVASFLRQTVDEFNALMSAACITVGRVLKRTDCAPHNKPVFALLPVVQRPEDWRTERIRFWQLNEEVEMRNKYSCCCRRWGMEGAGRASPFDRCQRGWQFSSYSCLRGRRRETSPSEWWETQTTITLTMMHVWQTVANIKLLVVAWSWAIGPKLSIYIKESGDVAIRTN